MIRLSPLEARRLREWYIRHRGRRSFERDARLRARIAPSIKAWMSNPARYDLPGVDLPGTLRPPRTRRAARLRRLDHWLRRGRGRRVRRGRPGRRSVTPEDLRLAQQIWSYVPESAKRRRHEPLRFIHVLNIARFIRRSLPDHHLFDPETIDWRLTYSEIIGGLKERYSPETRASRDYISWIESKLSRIQEEPASGGPAPPDWMEWEIRHADELL
jgi:hypothetical protein